MPVEANVTPILDGSWPRLATSACGTVSLQGTGGNYATVQEVEESENKPKIKRRKKEDCCFKVTEKLRQTRCGGDELPDDWEGIAEVAALLSRNSLL